MPLDEVRIDERTWQDADEARRHEYGLAMKELLGDDALSFPEDARTLSVTVAQQGIALALLSGAGEKIAEAVVPRSVLSPHVAEYVDIVRQLEQAQRGGGSTSVEALDMAKKLAHDDAARTLRRICRPLSADHDTCRRIWTLLLTLRVDTTRLTGVRGHRPVR